MLFLPCFSRCFGNGDEWGHDGCGGGQNCTKDEIVLLNPVVSSEMRDGVFSEGGAELFTGDIIYEIISDENGFELVTPLWEGGGCEFVIYFGNDI